MGRALARAARPSAATRVFLLGRERRGSRAQRRATSRSARRARRRSARHARRAICERPDEFAPALDAADAALGGFDTVVVTAGLFATQDRARGRRASSRAALLTVNFANTVVFCEEARRRLLARGGGTLCVFSSVAGERGRKPVIIYGAAKAGLSRYLEGLDHKFRASGPARGLREAGLRQDRA